MKSTRVGYRFLSPALLHTTNCFKESERDTERLWAGGLEGRQTVRRPDANEKEGRETERKGGREREKTRKEGGW